MKPAGHKGDIWSQILSSGHIGRQVLTALELLLHLVEGGGGAVEEVAVRVGVA